MPVEVVLVPHGVKVPDPAGRIAQEGVRELVQGADLGLVAKAANLRGWEEKVEFIEGNNHVFLT